MRRFDLVEYFELYAAIVHAQEVCQRDKMTAGDIYYACDFAVRKRLKRFLSEDDRFKICKPAVREVLEELKAFADQYILLPKVLSKETAIDREKFEARLERWQYFPINNKLETFRRLFSAECRDIEVYALEQTTIYKTSDLASHGSKVIAQQHRDSIPQEILKEFDDAGRCLVFDLPTACRFHALRGVELMILHYLKGLGVKTEALQSWQDSLKAFHYFMKTLQEGQKPPSQKIGALLDHTQEFDWRHPQNVSSFPSANSLFTLAATVVSEMASDLDQTDFPKRVDVPHISVDIS